MVDLEGGVVGHVFDFDLVVDGHFGLVDGWGKGRGDGGEMRRLMVSDGGFDGGFVWWRVCEVYEMVDLFVCVCVCLGSDVRWTS